MSDQPEPNSPQPPYDQPSSADATPFEPQEGWLTYIEKGGEPAGERRSGE